MSRCSNREDPLVLGIGLAATRDLGSFSSTKNRTRRAIVARLRTHYHAIAEGSSQSGTFLRLSLLLGFNQDSAVAWCGRHEPAHRRSFTNLNRRFAFPGGLVAARAWTRGTGLVTPWQDAARRRPMASLLDRCRATNTCPRIVRPSDRRRCGVCASRLRSSERPRRPTSRFRERASLLLRERIAGHLGGLPSRPTRWPRARWRRIRSVGPMPPR
jgi:hypothetical protein